MISIRKATEDLDRLEELIKVARETYAHAIWSSAQYSIEVHDADTNKFRARLDLIRNQALEASTPEDWQLLRSSLRGELRDHRERSMAHITRMRVDLKAAAEAMEVLAENVAASGVDHKAGLKEALDNLDSVAQEENLSRVRNVLTQTKSQINASIETIEREHNLIIAQLRDEIRSLHEQIDADRRAQEVDGITGVWNHQKLLAQMAGMLDHDESFCVLVVSIRNLRRLDQRYSPAVIEGGLKALLQRLSGMLGNNTRMGRWDEESFVAILQIDPTAAIGLSRQASQKLSGTYAVQENGMSRNIELQAVAGIIERQHGMDNALFHKKLQQLAEVLSSA